MACPDLQQFPEWFEYVKIFSTPFVALVAAGITWYFALQQKRIAAQQMKTAKEKLKLDLFDRRYAAYKAVESMLQAILHNRSTKIEDLTEFNTVVGEAEWLLDSELKKYLATSLRDSVMAYIKTEATLAAHREPALALYPTVEQIEEKKVLAKTWEEQRKCLYAELIALPNRFAKDMKIVKPNNLHLLWGITTSNKSANKNCSWSCPVLRVS